MDVFISWSGEPSGSVARALRNWLPLIVKPLKPWISDDIATGTPWNYKIASALEATDYGIVCVTASAQHRPWLMFEAGALAKRLDTAQVVPLCIDLVPSEVTGPLAAFQACVLDSTGMRKLVQDMNDLNSEPLDDRQIDTLFDALWPQLEAAVEDAKQAAPEGEVPKRTVQDMLEELVERARVIERNGTDMHERFLQDAFLTSIFLSEDGRKVLKDDPAMLDMLARALGRHPGKGMQFAFSIKPAEIPADKTVPPEGSGAGG